MRRSALLLLSCGLGCCAARPAGTSITVMLRNPAPYALEQWRSDPTIVQVTVSNPTSSSKRFVLDLYLQNQNTRQEVQTNEMHPCMPVFELAPGQTRTLNGPELICEPSLVYDATIRTQLTTTGAIPEGEYRFCVRALDADSRSRELTSSGALCASTQVQWYDPPAIVRPVARDRGLRCDQAIVLNWQPPIPVPAPGSVVYRVRVVGMFEGQLPRQALEAATRSETVVDAEVSTTSYTIGANDPVILDLLRRAAPRCIGFAWQVQALQATTRRPFPTRGGTQGKSTIETFTVECPGSTASEGASCSGAMSLRCYYPLDGDTIPWIPPHLIVQWSPYCDDVIGFTFELNVTGRGVTGTNRRTLNWPRGPIEGQSLRGFPRASERAQLHIVNWQTEAGTTPAFNNNFQLGETYRWSVNGTLVRRESGRDVSYPRQHAGGNGQSRLAHAAQPQSGRRRHHRKRTRIDPAVGDPRTAPTGLRAGGPPHPLPWCERHAVWSRCAVRACGDLARQHLPHTRCVVVAVVPGNGQLRHQRCSSARALRHQELERAEPGERHLLLGASNTPAPPTPAASTAAVRSGASPSAPVWGAKNASRFDQPHRSTAPPSPLRPCSLRSSPSRKSA
jgi:hypothetical protein